MPHRRLLQPRQAYCRFLSTSKPPTSPPVQSNVPGSTPKNPQQTTTVLTALEPKGAEVTPAYFTSDVPIEMMTKRKCRIFLPTKNAMQSGINETRRWQVDFDAEQKWTNPLMGWASSADAVQAMRLRFDSLEEAVNFAEKQGWDYAVQAPPVIGTRKKSYGDNFKYSAGKLRLVRTK